MQHVSILLVAADTDRYVESSQVVADTLMPVMFPCPYLIKYNNIKINEKQNC